MACGLYRNRAVIEQVTETRNPDGGFSESWTKFHISWFGAKQLRSNDLFAAQQLHPYATAEFTFRYSKKLAKVTEKMRIRADGEVWGIVGIDNVRFENREIKMTVTKGLRD